MNKPAHFILKTNGAKGELDAKVGQGFKTGCLIKSAFCRE